MYNKSNENETLKCEYVIRARYIPPNRIHQVGEVVTVPQILLDFTEQRSASFPRRRRVFFSTTQ
jgi:hypothetical protein